MLCTHQEGELGVGGEKRNQGREAKGGGGSTIPCRRAGAALGLGISDVQLLFCFVLIKALLRNYSHTIQFTH